MTFSYVILEKIQDEVTENPNFYAVGKVGTGASKKAQCIKVPDAKLRPESNAWVHCWGRREPSTKMASVFYTSP